MVNLDTKITDYFNVSARYKKALEKAGLVSLRDLLYFFPTKYEDLTQAISISQTPTGKLVSLYGELSELKKTLSWKTKKYTTEAKLCDTTGCIKLKWFNQSYIESMLKDAKYLKITGKATGKNSLYIANPEFETLSSLPDVTKSNKVVVPIYPEKRGIKSSWLAKKINQLITDGTHLSAEEILPKHILEKYNLPDIQTSLKKAHFPLNTKEAEAVRKRFAFESVFLIQLKQFQEKQRIKQSPAHQINIDKPTQKIFFESLPYKLTSAQLSAIKDVSNDLQNPYPMQRLIQGDVGSGKTTVAAAAAFFVASNPLPGQRSGMLQTAYMVPTEILARQQFAEFIGFFSDKLKHKMPKIALLTSKTCMIYPSKLKAEPTKISKSQLLKWIKDGSVTVVVGTHSLIQKTVEFKALALTIIDEQHRFGVIQRAQLARKSKILPHLISMTATPIPRTLALTVYGSLDISVIDQMPAGRKPPKTKLAKEKDRKLVYEFIGKQLKAGRQAYVICPRIQEPDPAKALALRVASAEKEYERIKKQFPQYNVGILHGKLTPKEKEEVMEKFEKNEIQILVSTTVVEVGVNVPNASVMIIEGAERFGLAQLHQLRGRIQRSTHQPYCFLFATNQAPENIARLKVFEKVSDGFKLAEHDLTLRGAGELTGTSQWGISDVAMEAIKNIKMVEFARKEAQELLKKDENLTNYPLLKKQVKNYQFLHLE